MVGPNSSQERLDKIIKGQNILVEVYCSNTDDDCFKQERYIFIKHPTWHRYTYGADYPFENGGARSIVSVYTSRAILPEFAEQIANLVHNFGARTA